MDITTTRTETATVLAVGGRMDALSAPEFETACKELQNQGVLSIIADLTHLEYISSAGLRSILTAAKQLRAAGGALHFCGLGGMVADVFKVSGFLKMFKVFGTRAEALGT